MTKELHSILVDLRCALARVYGDALEELWLYGSRARNDARPGSDVDVAVVLRQPRTPWEEIRHTSDVVAGLSLKHDIVLALTFVDEGRFRAGQGSLVRNIRAEGVCI